MKVWGLTGGIAAGKSTAARFFAESGIPVIDADAIARELTEANGLGHEAVLKRFGTVDRAELRKLVFADPKAREDLEAILHPLIRSESWRKMQALGVKVVIYEAALLVEAKRHTEMDGLIVVDAPRETRLARLKQRDGISDELAEQILKAQLPDQERNKSATFILKNDSTPDALKNAVLKLVPLIKHN